ncbi:hypothetical protein EON65_51670 [archaeon]|nr:MAG: hypothetical protein EON65_51670 [archaeon]
MKGVTSALDAKFLKQRRQKLQRSVLVPSGNSVSEAPDSLSLLLGASSAASIELSDEERVSNAVIRQSSQSHKQMKHAHSQPLLQRGKKASSKHAASLLLLEDYGLQLKDERDARSLLEAELEKSIRSIFQEVQMRRLLSLHKSSTRYDRCQLTGSARLVHCASIMSKINATLLSLADCRLQLLRRDLAVLCRHLPLPVLPKLTAAAASSPTTIRTTPRNMMITMSCCPP